MVGYNDESFRWIKILLEDSHEFHNTIEPVINARNLLRKVGKTADEVVADYLKCLWEYTLDDIKRKYPDYQLMFSLRVIVTVPAIWSQRAQVRTLQAAMTAGLPHDIELVTEPEAAAIAAFREKVENDTIQVVFRSARLGV